MEIRRQIIVVGPPRTATRHMAKMMKRVFEQNDVNARSHHQKKIEALQISRDRNLFNSCWEKSRKMLQINKKYPFLRFFINYRDPIDCCESLLQFRKNNRANHPDTRLSHDELANRYWISPYTHILEALRHLNHTPHVIEFEKYSKGQYNDLFLNVYGFELSQKNRSLMSMYISKKDHSSGVRQEQIILDETMIRTCEALRHELMEKCKHSWVETELT